MEFKWSSDGLEKRVFATYQLPQEQGAEGAGQGAELHLQYKNDLTWNSYEKTFERTLILEISHTIDNQCCVVV